MTTEKEAWRRRDDLRHSVHSEKRAFRKVPHRLRSRKTKGTVQSLPDVCTGCGLVLLNNAATARALKASCDAMEE